MELVAFISEYWRWTQQFLPTVVLLFYPNYTASLLGDPLSFCYCGSPRTAKCLLAPLQLSTTETLAWRERQEPFHQQVCAPGVTLCLSVAVGSCNGGEFLAWPKCSFIMDSTATLQGGLHWEYIIFFLLICWMKVIIDQIYRLLTAAY